MRIHRPLAVVLATLLVLGVASAPAAAQVLPGTPAAPAAPAEPPAAETGMTSQEAARALIGILDDEAARSRLIGELGRIAAGVEPAAGAGAEAAPEETLLETTFAQELGVHTQTMMREVVEVSTRIWMRLSNLADVFTGRAAIDWPALLDQLRSLAIVAAIAFGVLWLARILARWPLASLAELAASRGAVLRVALLALAAVVEFLCLAVAWAATLAAVGSLAAAGDGRVGLVESIFANAFAAIEAVKILIRMGFAPRRPGLRLFPMSDETARYWNRQLALIADFIGYGLLLVVPIVTATVSFAVGLGLRLAIVLAALGWWLALIARNRQRVRAGLADAGARTPSVTLTTVLALVAPVWHLILGGYAVVAFLVWVTRPFDAIGFMVSATLQSAAAVVVGGSLMALISRAITGGVRLPADVKGSLPLLEERLNMLVPGVLRALRIVMAGLIIAGVLQAWDLIDVGAWASGESGALVIRRSITAVVIIVVAMAIWIAATSWIEYRLHPAGGRVSTPRMRTLLSLFRNAFTILLVVIAAMLALSELGVDIAPLIAGAGVLGLAIGFGSQKLVQDIINGAFIQFENAMNEGDVVTVAGISGVVERLTIRSVGLRDLSGVYHIIPFSSVDSVSNFMRGFAFHLAELRVSREEDVAEVKRLMFEAFDRLAATEHRASILEPLEMHGVTDFIDGAVIVRARIKTLPGKQWEVGRAFNEIVKAVFNENDIALPAAPASVWIEGAANETVHRRPARTEAVRPAPEESDAAGDG